MVLADNEILYNFQNVDMDLYLLSCEEKHNLLNDKSSL